MKRKHEDLSTNSQNEGDQDPGAGVDELVTDFGLEVNDRDYGFSSQIPPSSSIASEQKAEENFDIIANEDEEILGELLEDAGIKYALNEQEQSGGLYNRLDDNPDLRNGPSPTTHTPQQNTPELGKEIQKHDDRLKIGLESASVLLQNGDASRFGEGGPSSHSRGQDNPTEDAIFLADNIGDSEDSASLLSN